MPAQSLPAFTGVYVFGDSLVDPGNDLKVAQFLGSLPFGGVPDGAPTADKGYFQGRFSNGYNFADLVANKALHEATQPTFPFGASNILAGFSVPVAKPEGNNLSFAYGGATAAGGNAPAPTLHTQIDIASNFDADPNALYVVSIGANDILALVPTGGAPVTGDAATAKLSTVASTIAQEVAQLVSRGVRHVLVADVPDVSVTPGYAGAQDEATRRSLLSQYAHDVNAMLKSDLAALNLPAGAVVSTYDFLGYTDEAVADPAAHHFSNVTQALRTVQPNAPDPTGGGFLFFDKLHPTAQAHAQIASHILAQLEGGAPSWTAAPSVGAQAASAVAAGGLNSFTASLTAGKTYVVDALGVSTASGTLADPQVRVVDSSGAVVAQADDGGIGLDSHLQFAAPATGDFQVQVLGVGVTAGAFHLQAADTSGTNLLLTGDLRGSGMTVLGDPTNDTITALAGANVLRGNDGDDRITGGANGFDNINGNKGDDVIVGRSSLGDWLLGGQGSDLIDATQSSGRNIINGNIAADTLSGGSGGDTLRGGQGDDVIRGGAGADWISGDLGQNTVTGGAGADTFHLAAGGTTVVTDFQQAQGDRVLVDAGLTFATIQAGADVHVDVTSGGGGELVLQGVTLASLTDGWIVQG
jgi:phospholipase/lecithinase/hemolysin